MREHFGQFGTVQDIRVFKDKGFAFIRCVIVFYGFTLQSTMIHLLTVDLRIVKIHLIIIITN